MVFTASHACYAKAIVDLLDPERKYIQHWFSREYCFKASQGFYVKDLRVIDRKMENILLVDNVNIFIIQAAYSYCLQPDNGVPIVPFYDNKADLELKNLMAYLKKFQSESDLRIKNAETMKISQFSRLNSCEEVL